MRALWLPRTREPLARAFGQVEHQANRPAGLPAYARRQRGGFVLYGSGLFWALEVKYAARVRPPSRA